MKKLEFKAWDKEKKRMIEPDWWGVQSSNGRMFDNEANYLPYEPEDRFVVIQYIGLKDKHKKKIYEGDIIIGFIERDIPCLIEPIGTEEVSEGYLSICASPKGKHACYALQLGEENIEIIGNIYENPELLNENI